MKKFLVLLVVAALTLVTSMAFADIKLSGTMDTRSRNFDNKDMDDTVGDHETQTQSRFRLNIDATAGDAKAKFTIENDWDTWGQLETAHATGTVTSSTTTSGSPAICTDGAGNYAAANTGLNNDCPAGMNPVAITATTTNTVNAGRLKMREAWVSFMLPGTDINVKAGHMLAQLGNGWFFRSMKYGSDAWIVSTDIDNLHLGLVDVKAAEGNANLADDTDAYVIVATLKMDDNLKAGINLTEVHGRGAGGAGDDILQNIGLHATAKLGDIDLNAELDVQQGKNKTVATAPVKYKGKQLVVQAKIPAGPVTVDATVGYGTGEKLNATGADANTSDTTAYQTILDADPHYTFLYEYTVATAAGAKSTGFSNTTALGVGATAKLSDSLSLGASVWMLSATDKVWNANLAAGAGALTDDVGTEVDVKLNWKLADSVSWNWTLGLFQPGDAYALADPVTGATRSADDVQGIQGVLTVKF